MEKKNDLRKRLIVAADDFGLSETANKNILQLARLGKIDRVAVLAGGFVSREDIREFRENKIKIDLHLVLPQGIRKRRGVIGRSLSFLKNNVLKKTGLAEIEKDWVGQVGYFINKFGLVPDGINSHEYVHFYPPYIKIVLNLAKIYEIRHVRFGKKGVHKTKNIVSNILSFFHEKNRKYLASSGKETADHITSLDWIKKPEEFLKNLPAGTTELICHPERKKESELIKKYF